MLLKNFLSSPNRVFCVTRVGSTSRLFFHSSVVVGKKLQLEVKIILATALEQCSLASRCLTFPGYKINVFQHLVLKFRLTERTWNY